MFRHLLPIFERTGIQVRVVALGTGQALDMGKRGDADVVFVHDRRPRKSSSRKVFIERREVMYNDFIIVGPKSDPARAGGRDAVAALMTLAEKKMPFVSRGDKSGTHAAELRLWKEAGVDPAQGRGAWYRETGSGNGTHAQYRFGHECLRAHRPRHGYRSRTAASSASSFKATSGFSISMA